MTITDADREALTDEIAEAISESLDMDWQPKWAAPAIIAIIERERITAEQAGAPKWQPIATAPRDGTWIITAKIGWHHSADRIKIDMWDQPKNRYDVWHCSRAQFSGKYWTDGVERLVEPTHWMPLETPEPVNGPQGCAVAPSGWYCTREAGHDGPCAAIPIADALDPEEICK